MSSLPLSRETGRWLITLSYGTKSLYSTLVKKKIKFSSYVRKFRWGRLQSHVWLTASLYMVKYLRIFSYIRNPFLIYELATNPIWISFYLRKIYFLFYQRSLSRPHYSALFLHIFTTQLLIATRIRVWFILKSRRSHPNSNIFSRSRPNFSVFPRVIFFTCPLNFVIH